MARRKKSSVFSQISDNHLKLMDVRPLTSNQKLVFESQNHLILHGLAGTGKTYISCFLAYESMFSGEHERLVIIRSAVPTRDMGFLPGTDKEKSAVYEEPYKDIAVELFDRGDAYDILKGKKLVHFMTTSFIRGVTLKDAVIIVDECQNMTFHELDSIITRVGSNCRIIFCGDFRQSDLTRGSERQGMKTFLSILERMDGFDMIDFGVDDIVRSDFVKNYIVTKSEMGL